MDIEHQKPKKKDNFDVPHNIYIRGNKKPKK